MSTDVKRLLKYLSFIFIILFLVSCSNKVSTEDLAIQVKDSMIEEAKKQGTEIKIQKVTLVHKSGNEYTGVLETIETNDAFTYTIEVIYDGESFKWSIVK